MTKADWAGWLGAFHRRDIRSASALSIPEMDRLIELLASFTGAQQESFVRSIMTMERYFWKLRDQAIVTREVHAFLRDPEAWMMEKDL